MGELMLASLVFGKKINFQYHILLLTCKEEWCSPKKIILRLLSVLVFLPTFAFADLPLTVDGLLSAPNRWRAELGINYANLEQRGVSTGQPVSVQVAPAQFVYVPTLFGTARTNSDTEVLSPGLRYGLSDNTELYGRASWLSYSARIQSVNGVDSTSINRFDSAWLGINHQFIEEGKSPALLGFAEIAAIERSSLPGLTDTQDYSGHSALIGGTTYRVIDPIVLSFTGAYRINAPRVLNDQSYIPGNYLVLNPSMSFAVNSDITLSAGLLWRNTRADMLNGQDQGLLRTSTDFNFGLAWLWDERTVLNLNSSANLSGSGGANLGLTWTRKLGELPQRKRPGKSPSKSVSP